MARITPALLAFNRGEVSRLALARVDLERMRLAAETQVNYLPYVIGPMMMRPGLADIDGIRNNAPNRILPFVFSFTDTALLELTASVLRVWVDDALVTRAAVSTHVTRGDFSGTGGWTLVATGGASATISGGLLRLASPATGGLAQAKQQISVAAGDYGTEHGLTIVVDNGPVVVRAGSADGNDNYVGETTLDTGTFSLAFTPTGDIYLQIETTTAPLKTLSSVTIDPAGILELPTPWASADLPLVRQEQSGDVVFIACDGHQQRKIERRSVNGWGVALYRADDGPFDTGNSSDTTLTPGDLSGNTTLTASRPLFKNYHVGALFRLFSTGQSVVQSLATDSVSTSTIRVSGVGADRTFTYTVGGTFVATVTLQRSFESDTTGFVDIAGYSFTGPTTATLADTFDNVIVWYRFTIKTGNYTSGSADLRLDYSGGGAAGIARVTSITSRMVAQVEVLSAFSSLAASTDWNEGAWSSYAGWPSAVTFHEGRLWWFRGDELWGSYSNNYYSYPIDEVGDAAPINEVFGSGPMDVINWGLPLLRLIVGRETSEASVRSSSFDEPLTPTNFSVKDCSTYGSARIPAVKVDQNGIFVDKSGRRVYLLSFNAQRFDYAAHDLTRLNLDIGVPGFVAAATARQPDTIIHLVRGDGQVACLVFDPEDDVECWYRVQTNGTIENVAVLPGALEDRVYYSVARAGTRRLEKFARRDECVGGTTNKIADSHKVFSGSAVSSVSVPHLAGRQVVVWADGKALADVNNPATVAGDGTLAMPDGLTHTHIVVGLGYTAQFKSAKLAYGGKTGTPLTRKKKIDHLGLVAFDLHPLGLTYGQSFDVMDPLPGVEDGAAVNPDSVWDAYDQQPFELPGDWDTDARLCLQTIAPYPATIAGVALPLTVNE